MRYELLRTLGKGSTGAVFLALDRESGEQVALKKLQRMDQKSVLRLKREFRSLADMHHPNLVKLYDLGGADDGWFVTMEYVDGPDLLRYANDGADPELARDMSATRPFGAGAERAARDEQRVLDAFHQLACGVRALHEAGMLHRDLKPSNVLVAGGRVVVLDFGLVRQLDATDAPVVTQEGVTAGTPAYMAPEQAAGNTLDEAADWYAFGVMLYQALSGELPIEGRNALELLMRKSQVEPPTLSQIVPGIPVGLSELCAALLRREPSERPRGDAVEHMLSEQLARSAEQQRAKQPTDHGVLSQTRGREPNATLYGRQHELQQLMAAFEHVSQRAVVVHVRGTSGAGKSALVERFLDELAARPGRSAPLVLRSRCYEREAMPFKALDGLLDALVRHLLALDDIEVAHFLPTHVAELAQLFPALERLRAVERLLETVDRSSNALQVRLRAEVALRELLTRLAARRPLVLWIDDLQWGDLDSPEILKGWQEQLASSPILFVYSYRGDEVTTSPCLRELLERGHDRPPTQPDAERVIELRALDDADARALSAQRLGPLAAERPELAPRIALESQGNPFLVSQLAALVQARHARGELDASELSIEHLIAQARELLPPEAATILNVLAIAGRPIAPRLLLQAAGVRTEGRALLHALRGLRLIRARDVAGEHLIEAYHDRVREGVHAALTVPERALLHANLLAVLEGEGHEDADWMHTLALGAGFHEAALHHGLIAAERAKQTLAFERAAELFRACLDLSESAAAMSGELWLQYADALARCRHGVRAGEAYLEASTRADRRAALQLMRLAATHFLRSGDFTRGESIMREVLAGLGLSLPESDAGLIAAIAWERGALALRGLRYQPRTAAEVPTELMQKVELFGALTIETQAHHPLRGALLSARGLRWALEAGEPRQLARTLSMSATLACVSGSPRSGRRSDELLARARAIAEPLDAPAALAEVEAARSVCAFLLARPKQVIEASQNAERLYREDSRGDAVGDYYQRFAMLSVRVGALHVLGENRRAHAELQSVLQEARATNNRSVFLHLTLCQTFDDEVRNRASHSKARITEQRALLPKGRFGPLHVLHMLAILRTACSTNDYAWADPLLAEDWPRWQRSPVRAGGFLCLLVHSARARYRLNRMLVQRTQEDPVALVRDDLRVLGRLPFEAWHTTTRCRLRARLAYLAQRPEAAAELLRESLANMPEGAVAEAARDRHALGFAVGGEEGARLRAAADRFLRDSGIVDPIADMQAHYPEFLG